MPVVVYVVTILANNCFALRARILRIVRAVVVLKTYTLLPPLPPSLPLSFPTPYRLTSKTTKGPVAFNAVVISLNWFDDHIATGAIIDHVIDWWVAALVKRSKIVTTDALELIAKIE